MEFTIKVVIKVRPEKIYAAWLNSVGHSAMTGGEAQLSDEIGAQFKAWNGYIEGTNLMLEPNKRILQSWRTSEFAKSDPDSRLEIILTENNDQTELTLIHSNLPEHGEQYRQGWEDHYFTPMRDYFS